jgi:hypothetical protein
VAAKPPGSELGSWPPALASGPGLRETGNETAGTVLNAAGRFTMKWWAWVAAAAVAAVAVAWFAGKDDIRRYRRMKRL